MRKIITLFQRNYDGDHLVRDEVTPGAEWVLAGEGIATRKWDGTAVLIEHGKMWKRHEVKRGKTWPPYFRPAAEPLSFDPVTGKLPGWIPVSDGPEDRWHREALENDDATPEHYAPGTYELVGPKINGNPEAFPGHRLIRHGGTILRHVGRDFGSIRTYLACVDIEGIVWYRGNGDDMVKIKAKDFGLKRTHTGGLRYATY